VNAAPFIVKKMVPAARYVCRYNIDSAFVLIEAVDKRITCSKPYKMPG